MKRKQDFASPWEGFEIEVFIRAVHVDTYMRGMGPASCRVELGVLNLDDDKLSELQRALMLGEGKQLSTALRFRERNVNAGPPPLGMIGASDAISILCGGSRRRVTPKIIRKEDEDAGAG